jgi:predicted small integral membrane protein
MEMLRTCKAVLVAALAFFFGLVVFDNVTDYGSNYEFVHHVLAMDSTFPDNHLMWRSIQMPVIYHVFYIGIITFETICGTTLAYGAWRIFTARSATEPTYVQAKQIATAGLTLGLLLWMVVFLCIGGEWFAMWQSPTWNGQSAAFRMFTINGLILLFLWQPEATATA